jgi:large subunit ribosomal protein L13
LVKLWHHVDATNWAPGRLASYLSIVLQGKHKPHFNRQKDCGDYVVVTNAAFIQLTGKNLEQKVYYSHSGYMGGLKETKLKDVMHNDPATVLRKAVYGMLPKDKVRRLRMGRLYVFNGMKHPYEANIYKNYNPQDERLANVPIHSLRPAVSS